MSDTLPPMPEPCNSRKGYGQLWSPLFTEPQMHAYAAAAVAMERERCARLVEEMDNDYLRASPCRKALERAAKKIRAG